MVSARSLARPLLFCALCDRSWTIVQTYIAELAHGGRYIGLLMASQSLVMESTGQDSQPNLSRRYACDRCRNHKLRCNRDFMSPRSPCLRCRKARVNCTMGATTAAPSVHPRLMQEKQLPHPMPSTELGSSASSNSAGTSGTAVHPLANNTRCLLCVISRLPAKLFP